MGKNTKVMPQYPAIYLFSWEREGILMSKLITSALSDLPPARNDLDKASMTHLKNCPKYVYFFCKFCTFPVTEGNEIWHIYFQFTTPARKLTHNMKFEHFLDAERHEFWEHHNSLSPWARETPKSDPERHKFWQRHNSSSPWAREMPKSDPERHEF